VTRDEWGKSRERPKLAFQCNCGRCCGFVEVKGGAEALFLACVLSCLPGAVSPGPQLTWQALLACALPGLGSVAKHGLASRLCSVWEMFVWPKNARRQPHVGVLPILERRP